MAADFDGNGRTDIAISDGQTWRYSRDGRGRLTMLRHGAPNPPYPPLKRLLIGRFDGGPRAGVVSLSLRPRIIGFGRDARVVFDPGERLLIWPGLGAGTPSACAPSRTCDDAGALTSLAFAAFGLALAAGLALAGPGDLDRGFGAGGTRTIEGMGYAGAMAVQPDGKIVVAGLGANGDVAVGRINPDGSDDPAFGGTRLIDFGSFDIGEAVALQPDGKIVVVGRSGANAVIARLNPDGSPDMGFGTAGKRAIDYGGPSFDRAEGVAIQPDGKIILAGVGGLDPMIVVTRLEPDGADDTGFGPGGTRRVHFGLGYEEGRTVALQADGKIVVAGFTGDDHRIAIARLTPAARPTWASARPAPG